MDLSSKCKSLFVIHSCTLRDFMNDHRLEISPGNAFYQLNRPVAVEGLRNIIARKKSCVTFIEKDSFLSAIGVASSDSIALKDVHLADFDVFVQSASYAQILNGGTEFLYMEEEEVEDADAAMQTDVNENGSVPSAHASPVKVLTRAVGPPGTKGHELVVCFDTTGSMGACIKEVCKHAPDVFQHLFNDYPDLRIAPFAHGDYIDRFKYVTTFSDFTKDAWTIKDWMDGVETTYGGDWEECYELALHEIRTQLSWTADTKRSLVMIGDAIPHEPHLSEAKLDWQAELDALVNDLGVRVYAVQHGSNNLAKEFWRSLAHRSGGKHLILKEFTDATDMLVGICHREYGIDNFKKFKEDVELREKAKGFSDLKESLSEIFKELSTEDNTPAILREDSVVGRTVDFAKVKRRLAEMEEEETAKKKEEVVIAPVNQDESSRKRKMTPAEGESGTPVKKGKPLSAEEDLLVNGKEKSGEDEEKSGEKVKKVAVKRKPVALKKIEKKTEKKVEKKVVKKQNAVKKVVKKSQEGVKKKSGEEEVKKKKEVGVKSKALALKKGEKKIVKKNEDKKIEKDQVKKVVTKRAKKKSGEEKKRVGVKIKAVALKKVEKKAGKKKNEDKKVESQVKKPVKKKSEEAVKKRVVKSVDEKKKKKLDEKSKKMTPVVKKIVEKKKQVAEKERKSGEIKRKLDEQTKKLAAAKKRRAAEQKKKAVEKAKKLTATKKSVKTVKQTKTPAKKTPLKKSEIKAKNPTAKMAKKAVSAKKPTPKIIKPAMTTSMSKRRAAQSASSAWEMLKKSPKSDKTAITKAAKKRK